PGSRDSFFDHPVWKFPDPYSFFIFGSIFVTEIAIDVVFGRLVFQFFCNLFSDTHHFTEISLRIYFYLFFWKMIRQGYSSFVCRFSLAPLTDKLFLYFLLLLLSSLRIHFKRKAHLIFIAFKAFSFLTKSKPLVIGYLELQIRDFMLCLYSLFFL